MIDIENINRMIEDVKVGGKPWNDTLIYDLQEAVIYLLEQLKNQQPDIKEIDI